MGTSRYSVVIHRKGVSRIFAVVVVGGGGGGGGGGTENPALRRPHAYGLE